MFNWLLQTVGGWIAAGIIGGLLWCVYRIGTLIKSGIVYRRHLNKMISLAQKKDPRIQPGPAFHKEMARANRDLMLGIGAWAALILVGASFTHDLETAGGFAAFVTAAVAAGYWMSQITIRDTSTKEASVY